MKKDFSKIFSFSKIERFKKCPYGYYLNYLDPQWKGFQKPRDYKTKGTAVHGAITLFYHLPPEERNLENLKKCLKQAWFSDIEPQKQPPLGQAGGFQTIASERRAYLSSLKMLKRFLNLKDINPALFYLPTKDIRYSFSDYEEMIQPINDRFFISGKFDRVDKIEDGTLRIIDFKTGKKDNGKGQLDFYRILAEFNFNVPVSVVSYYYLGDGKVVDFSTSDVEIDEIKENILKNVEEINNTEKFSSRPSRLCSFCDFEDICEHAKRRFDSL